MAYTLEMYLKEETMKYINTMLADPKFRTQVNQEFAEICDPYVPFVTGQLAENIRVDSNGITYEQPYASNVYDSMNVHSKEFHPLATSQWDEVAFANHKDELTAKTKEIIEKWIKTKR